jgi:hypothetical protein
LFIPLLKDEKLVLSKRIKVRIIYLPLLKLNKLLSCYKNNASKLGLNDINVQRKNE